MRQTLRDTTPHKTLASPNGTTPIKPSARDWLRTSYWFWAYIPYSKVVAIVRSFILSIFGGSVDCFSDHRSISPISLHRFNSSFPSILNWPFAYTVICSLSNYSRDIVPKFCKVVNVGDLIGASVGKIFFFSWEVTLSTKWSNSYWDVNDRLFSYQGWWASSITNPKYLMSICSWINKNTWS